MGAVAIDRDGNLAAATSTGGINGKMVGRVSDTSQIGSGTYADDNIAAVSTTGHGETISKYCLAHAIVKAMEYGKLSAHDATNQIMQKMTARLNNTAGSRQYVAKEIVNEFKIIICRGNNIEQKRGGGGRIHQSTDVLGL